MGSPNDSDADVLIPAHNYSAVFAVLKILESNLRRYGLVEAVVEDFFVRMMALEKMHNVVLLKNSPEILKLKLMYLCMHGNTARRLLLKKLCRKQLAQMKISVGFWTFHRCLPWCGKDDQGGMAEYLVLGFFSYIFPQEDIAFYLQVYSTTYCVDNNFIESFTQHKMFLSRRIKLLLPLLRCCAWVFSSRLLRQYTSVLSQYVQSDCFLRPRDTVTSAQILHLPWMLDGTRESAKTCKKDDYGVQALYLSITHNKTVVGREGDIRLLLESVPKAVRCCVQEWLVYYVKDLLKEWVVASMDHIYFVQGLAKNIEQIKVFFTACGIYGSLRETCENDWDVLNAHAVDILAYQLHIAHLLQENTFIFDDEKNQWPVILLKHEWVHASLKESMRSRICI